MAQISKGERDAILAKPPIEFGKILKRNAKASNLTYGEYLVLLAAERLDLPQYAPHPTPPKGTRSDVHEEAHAKAA